MTDLIKQVGGLQKAKDIVGGAPKDATIVRMSITNGRFLYCSGKVETSDLHISLGELRQAIADYNTDHCGDIINHVSPSTQVYDK